MTLREVLGVDVMTDLRSALGLRDGHRGEVTGGSKAVRSPGMERRTLEVRSQGHEWRAAATEGDRREKQAGPIMWGRQTVHVVVCAFGATINEG